MKSTLCWLASALLVLGATLLGACDPGASPELERAASEPPKVPPHTALMLGWVGQARAEASKLNDSIATGRASRPHYLALRGAIARAAPFLRTTAPLGSEVLLGPPESADEAGGALLRLDAALGSASAAATTQALEQVRRALEVIHGEVSLNGVSPEGATAALADACFELGLMLLEASATTPADPDAVRADLLGMLDGIDAVAAATVGLADSSLRTEATRAHAQMKAPSLTLRTALAAAKDSHALVRRLDLVRHSGELGDAARSLAAAVKVQVKAPYVPLKTALPAARNAPLTALWLPQPPHLPIADASRQAQIELGRRLFFDRRLSKSDVRSCADCHQPDKALSDGVRVATSLLFAQPISRNTPTLLYAPLNAAQLWDGRFAGIARQAERVLHARTEMGLTQDELATKMATLGGYESLRSTAADPATLTRTLAQALDAFQQASMLPGDSALDRYARGDRAALSPEQLAGFDVLAGVGRCTRCHLPPSFAGSRPPRFNTPVFANLGVLDKPLGKQLDSDMGRASFTHNAKDARVFKTPTLRNLPKTGPYFHHGRFATLEQVVDFYNLGGGRGAGLTVPGQDPDVRPLKLTPAQRDALLLVLRTALVDSDEAIAKAVGKRPTAAELQSSSSSSSSAP